MQETVWNSRVNDIKKSIEGLQSLFNARGECIQRLSKEVEELEKRNEYLKKELEETYRTKEAELKNHNKRDLTLVDELAKKNDEIKKLEELNEYLRNQLRMKTDELKALELEGHFELDEKSQLAILAGAYAIRKHFDDGAYCNIAANGIISWKHAEQVLMDMVTKE